MGSHQKMVPKYHQLKDQLLIFDLDYFRSQIFWISRKKKYFPSPELIPQGGEIVSIQRGLSKEYIGKDLRHDAMPENTCLSVNTGAIFVNVLSPEIPSFIAN